MADPNPAPVLLAVGIGGVLLLSAMAFAFAGPGPRFMEGFMGDWDWEMDMDIDMDGGDVEVRSVRAASTYDLASLRREAVVDVTLHADDPEEAWMHVSLSAEPCNATGGHRVPSDRETVRLDARNGTWTERVTLSGTMPPGPASVVVEVERDGMYGPNVSRTCRDLPRS